jgi:hypothetical protein
VPLSRGGLGGLAGVVSSLKRRIGVGKASEFDVAAREAFRAGIVVGAPTRLRSAPQTSPAPRPDMLRPISTALTPMAGVGRPTPEAPNQPERNPWPTRPPRQAGDTAPDFLLRRSEGVAAVADDFFDSLVRRVEGDR